VNLDEVAPVPDLYKWMADRELMHTVVKQHLLRAQTRMKRQADKGRSERQFSVGDMVFLKLQPYIQSSLFHRSNNKLSFKFFGPFQVIQKVGPVAYKLLLPPGAAVHPVFHISQLRSSLGNQQVSPSLPSDLQQFQFPLRVLQRRWTSGARPVAQGLIQWSHSPPELSTWEPLEQLRHQFPRAPAWGHAGSEDGGNVSSLPPPVPVTGEEDAPGAEEEAALAVRPKRLRRPSTRIVGPMWQV